MSDLRYVSRMLWQASYLLYFDGRGTDATDLGDWHAGDWASAFNFKLLKNKALIFKMYYNSDENKIKNKRFDVILTSISPQFNPTEKSLFKNILYGSFLVQPLKDFSFHCIKI